MIPQKKAGSIYMARSQGLGHTQLKKPPFITKLETLTVSVIQPVSESCFLQMQHGREEENDSELGGIGI